MLRIHSDMVCLFAFALASIDSNSLGVTRTRSIPALALPFGRGGLPAFLRFGSRCLFMFPKLPYDPVAVCTYHALDPANFEALGQHRDGCSLPVFWQDVRHRRLPSDNYRTPGIMTCRLVFMGYNYGTMRRWLKRWWWLCAAVGAAILVIAWQEGRCQAQANQCRTYYTAQDSHLLGKDINSSAAEQQAINAACEPNGYFCRLFSAANIPTWLLVFIGIGGIWAALKTLDTIKQQADLTKEQLILAYRPKISVRALRIVSPSGDAPPGGVRQVISSWHSVEFCIVNTGGTTAKIKEVLCIGRVLDSLPGKRPWEGKPGSKVGLSLAPGRSEPYSSPIELPGSAGGSLGGLLTGNKSLYVMGWTRYEDASSISRTTLFCRCYEPRSDRFFSVNDTDYESED